MVLVQSPIDFQKPREQTMTSKYAYKTLFKSQLLVLSPNHLVVTFYDVGYVYKIFSENYIKKERLIILYSLVKRYRTLQTSFGRLETPFC